MQDSPLEQTMKAAVVHEAGDPSVLRIEEREIPAVKPGWSLVRVRAAGVNHSEVFTRQGLSPSVKFPRILGIECVGEIVRTSDSQRLPIGTRVVSIMGEMGRAYDGGYAQYALLPNENIYSLEGIQGLEKLGWETIGAIPETYYTAFGSMLNLKIEVTDKVFVRAASSGVGVAFAKLLKARYPDIYLAGSVRSLSKAEQLHDVGFNDVILDNHGELQIESASDSERFTKVLDLVGPAAIKDTIKYMSENSIVCITGLLGNKWFLEDFDPIIDLPANGYLTSFYSGNVDEVTLRQLFEYIITYEVDASPARVFTLDEVAKAHELIESGTGFGKIVISF